MDVVVMVAEGGGGENLSVVCLGFWMRAALCLEVDVRMSDKLHLWDGER